MKLCFKNFSQQQQQQQRPDQQPQMPQQTGFPGPQQTMPNQPVQNPQGAQFGVKIDIKKIDIGICILSSCYKHLR